MLYFPSRRKRAGLWWSVAGVIVLIIVLNIAPARGALQKFFGPVGGGLVSWSGGLRDWFDGMRPAAEIEHENEDLKNINADLLAENARLKAVMEENKILRQLAGLTEKVKYDLVMARVVGRVQELPGADKTYLLDRGRADGLKKGMPVISAVGTSMDDDEASGGYLIGKILEADESWSQMLLITDYNSHIAATVMNVGGELDCVVSGKHGLSLEAEYLPINEKIAAGDLLVTSGLETLVPPGLLIGRIGGVQTQPGDLFHRVDVEPLGKLTQARWLMVIKNYAQKNE